MRISISNIAWDTNEDEIVAQLLQTEGIDAIDIAPGKYFPNPREASDSEILKVKNWWASQKIEIVGMQALLFGTSGLNIFGSDESRELMLLHLESICRIGGLLGATKLVFGSPKNRDRSGLSEDQTLTLACSFFAKLGNIAHKHGVVMCLEPNPPCYGANFMTTSEETAKIVTLVNHPAIRMQLDTGAIAINQEHIQTVVSQFKSFIGHIHISEPNLIPIGDAQTNHHEYGLALRQELGERIATIEMVAPKNEPHPLAIRRALGIVKTNYGGGDL
ncbi:MAG: hypothetical protein RJB66_1699 [Pseudomonadota bacterium]|jgi:sugar phosphate isomerase/epimerase